MKNTLFAIGIATVVLAVGTAAAEEQPQGKTAGSGKRRAAASATGRVHGNGNVQRHQVGVRQNTGVRSFNQGTTVNNRTATHVNRSNVGTNRVTARERGFRHNQANVNNNV